MPQDYLMRLIEQIGAMLAGVLNKRREGKWDEVRHDLRTLCLENIGLPLEAVKSRSPDAIADYLSTAGANRYARAVMLAEILIQDAETLESLGNLKGAAPGYVHAFCLLFDAYPVLSEEEQAVYRAKLEALAEKLEELPRQPYTAARVKALKDL